MSSDHSVGEFISCTNNADAISGTSACVSDSSPPRLGKIMRRKPVMIMTVPSHLSPRKESSGRHIASAPALIGIPRTVPNEIKSGKVKAMPKLIKKLKSKPSAAEPHRNPQGIAVHVIFSTRAKYTISTTGQKHSRLIRPRQVRKRLTSRTPTSPANNLKETFSNKECSNYRLWCTKLTRI